MADRLARSSALYDRVRRVIPPIEWPTFLDDIDAILELKRQRNAVVLAHNYQTPKIFHCVADIVGDSLALARKEMAVEADVIVLAGVHFIAETAKLLNQEKTVLIPDLKAGCSLADSITAADCPASAPVRQNWLNEEGIDVPARFRNSRAVGPALGLTPVVNQSGESHRVGRISLCGDGMMRTLLYEAAQVMLTRTKKWSWLKAWAMNVAKRRGLRKANVALARRLAVIMHRMWSDGAEFRWTREIAGSLAARRLNDEAREAITAAHKRCELSARADDSDDYYYANEEFHKAIYATSRSEFLQEQCTQLHRRLRPYRRLQLRVRNRLSTSFSEHCAIVDAIFAGEGEEARRLLRAHVGVQGERFSDLVASMATR